MTDWHIREIQPDDEQWIRQLMVDRWGGESVVAHGRIYQPHKLPGFISEDEGGQHNGLLTYEISNGELEIVTLDSLREGLGIGTALINIAIERAEEKWAGRAWLITTNDNLSAIAFYQKRGFVIAGINRNALDYSRKLKPSIPMVSENGIPIRDEIEFEYPLKGQAGHAVRNRETICLKPIGVIHTPHKERRGTPIQPAAAKGIQGEVEVFDEYAPGLADLDGFSHITLLYNFDRVKETRLRVVPYLDDTERGVFATRAPVRPNGIGLSTVKLLGIEGNRLYVSDIDMLDGTPLLDIKPYVPTFDKQEAVRLGWLERGVKKARETKDDGRFGEGD